MPANNRTGLQREYHRLEAARRYIRGETQPKIAEALGISRELVKYDLSVIQERWKQSGLYDLNEYKARELARIDEVEREAWLAWDASKQDKEIAVQKSGGGERPLEVKEAMLRKEGQSGNPAFLTIVMECIKQRCKLLGLEPKPTDDRTFTINITDARERLAHRLFEAAATGATFTVDRGDEQ